MDYAEDGGDDGGALSVEIADLPDALNLATYTRGRHALIVDNADGMASRFLRYQRGCYLQHARREDVEQESLRKQAQLLEVPLDAYVKLLVGPEKRRQNASQRDHWGTLQNFV